ncbi:MAG: hypothetical protein R3F17_03725 [Planctomycetota bacterium]
MFQARARSTETDLNGLPGLVTAEGAVTGAIQHVVFTRDRDGATSLYVDGEVQAESTLAGTFDNWDSGYQLLVANEAGAKSLGSATCTCLRSTTAPSLARRSVATSPPRAGRRTSGTYPWRPSPALR